MEWSDIAYRIADSTNWLLGFEPYPINLARMMVRASIVYMCVLVFVRFGERRFMGKNTVFDFILGIVLGSVSSRAITDSSPFFPTLAASAMLVALHWLFAAMAFRYKPFGAVVKGMPHKLVKDGQIDWDTMHEYHITRRDLEEYLRQHGQTSLDNVEQVWLERNGQLSIINGSSRPEPRILEVSVAEGVQTIRIAVE